MSGKRIAGLVCILLAALLGLGAVASLSVGNGPAVNDGSGLGVSRAVGAFLPAFGMLILGVWLFQKPKPPAERPRRVSRRDDDSE